MSAMKIRLEPACSERPNRIYGFKNRHTEQCSVCYSSTSTAHVPQAEKDSSSEYIFESGLLSLLPRASCPNMGFAGSLHITCWKTPARRSAPPSRDEDDKPNSSKAARSGARATCAYRGATAVVYVLATTPSTTMSPCNV